MSPPAFRSTFPGLAYQLGNMISSASSQIEALGGEHNKIIVHGKQVPDYAKVQGIFIGVVAVYVVVMTLIGPENHASHFEKSRTAFETGAAEGAEIQHEEHVLKDLEGRTPSSSRRSFTEKSEEEKREIA
jgi:SHS family lactate transporter-like MFS transporter